MQKPILRSAFAVLVFGTIFAPRVLHAQQYCENANDAGNKEYPEMDSKCTPVTHGPDGTVISARFLGPQVATKSSDPICGYPATDVKCRRICGDLPSGKKPGATLSKVISPPGYARFDMFEAFDKGDHFRVCYRVKNWANSGLNNGEYRTFTFKMSYK